MFKFACLSVNKYNPSLPLVILNALILMYQFIYLVTKCAKFLTADIKRLCASIYQNSFQPCSFFIFVQVFNLECVRLDLFNGFYQNRFKMLVKLDKNRKLELNLARIVWILEALEVLRNILKFISV